MRRCILYSELNQNRPFFDSLTGHTDRTGSMKAIHVRLYTDLASPMAADTVEEKTAYITYFRGIIGVANVNSIEDVHRSFLGHPWGTVSGVIASSAACIRSQSRIRTTSSYITRMEVSIVADNSISVPLTQYLQPNQPAPPDNKSNPSRLIFVILKADEGKERMYRNQLYTRQLGVFQ